MSNTQIDLDEYGGFTGITGRKTGFFHIEEISGRQWMVTPLGNAFLPVALSHPYTGESGYVCEEQYEGDYGTFVRDTFDKLVDLGFNCSLAADTSPERNLSGFIKEEPILRLFEEKNFPYTVGIYLLKHPWEFAEGERYPDIYSEQYLSQWAEIIEDTCTKYKENPLVLGYYYGFGGLNDEVGLIHSHLELPEESPGRRKVLEHFKTKYANDIDRYNVTYDRNAHSIEDLDRDQTPRFPKSIEWRLLRPGQKELSQDLIDDFETTIANITRQLYRFAYKEIRKWDSNHLIFGSYIKPYSFTAEAWKEVAPYLDVIAPQHIMETPEITELVQVSGLPALISDERFGIVYPDKSRFHAVDSHTRRGQIYEQNLKTIASHPGIVGVSYCNCMFDQYHPVLQRAFGEPGIYDRKGRERLEVSGPIRMANRKIYEMAARSGQEAYRRNKQELLRLWEEASAGLRQDSTR